MLISWTLHEGWSYDHPPRLPLKTKGAVKHMQWEAKTCWAIDAEDNVFIDNGHGPSLRRIKNTAEGVAATRQLYKNEFEDARLQRDSAEEKLKQAGF